MTILFDATAPVKSTRRFGAGILPTRPAYRADFSVSDSAWLVEDNARRAAEDRELDLQWVASLNLDRMTAGFCS